MGAGCSEEGEESDLGVGNYTPLPGAVMTLSAALRGKPSAPVSGELRLAIVWDGANIARGPGYTRRVSDVGIAKSWPVRFKADVLPPPSDAVERRPMSVDTPPLYVEVSTGWIVAYEDTNGNGTLDLVGPNESTIDKIVSDGGDIYLFWQNATDSDWVELQRRGTQGLFERGVNIVRDSGALWPLGPECVASPCEEPTSTGRIALPKEQEVELPTFASADRAGRLVCESFHGIDSGAGGIDRPCPSPLPAVHGVICQPDRTVYSAALFEEPVSLCDIDGKIRYCGVRRDPTAPVPVDWPCK